MKQLLWFIVFLNFCLLNLCLSSCKSYYPHREGLSQYLSKIRNNSAGDKQFSGVYENFEFHSTLFTHDVSLALHHRLKLYYDWSPSEAEKRLKNRMEETRHQTKIWLSFYTPNSRDDNLSTKKSIWKIYLINKGVRHEGSISNTNMNFSKAKALFPYHSRWTTGYYVSFPLPTDELEAPVTLVITGPLGQRKVVFPH